MAHSFEIDAVSMLPSQSREARRLTGSFRIGFLGTVLIILSLAVASRADALMFQG